jgi:hypothetical protein
LQPAIDAAQPSDVLLVEPGSYSPFVLSKPLRIYAQPGATIATNQSAQVEITGIPAGAEAVVHGLTIDAPCDFFGWSCHTQPCPAMSVHDNAGTVLIQSQRLLGVSLVNNALVLVDDCHVAGLIQSCGPGWTGVAGPGVAIDAVSSSVWIVGSTIVGGDGAKSPGNFYGFALRAVDSTVYAAESTFEGADGDLVLSSCFGGGPTMVGIWGKPGIDARGASLVKVVSGPGLSIVGGDGGSSSCPGKGAPGVDLYDTSFLHVVASIAISGGQDGASPGGALASSTRRSRRTTPRTRSRPGCATPSSPDRRSRRSGAPRRSLRQETRARRRGCTCPSAWVRSRPSPASTARRRDGARPLAVVLDRERGPRRGRLRIVRPRGPADPGAGRLPRRVPGRRGRRAAGRALEPATRRDLPLGVRAACRSTSPARR